MFGVFEVVQGIKSITTTTTTAAIKTMKKG